MAACHRDRQLPECSFRSESMVPDTRSMIENGIKGRFLGENKADERMEHWVLAISQAQRRPLATAAV